jgi:PncC family amidohydrolase
MPSTPATTSPTPDLVSLAERLAAKLVERNETLAVAEGATGGLLSHALTQIPGSSAWFRAGIVAYTDYPKQLLLRVSTETLEEFGSISIQATVQMARLVRRIFGTHWGLAVTGYADERAAAVQRPTAGVPLRDPAGTPRIAGEPSPRQPGQTFLAISGPAATLQGEGQLWEERLLPAPDRATYKAEAAAAALELLLATIEG